MAKFISLDNLTRAFGVLKIAFSSSTAKTTLADGDMFIIMDSADTETVNGVAGVKKRKGISWSNFKVELGNFFAAADALVFKGTLGTGGTVTALPTTYQVGWTYRIITAGTYAGNACEVGDLIIALVDRSGSGNVNADWTVAQNNADLSGIPTAADTNPLMNGTVAIGVSTKYARQDHVHPVDTSRAASSHTHSESDVTNLTTDLAAKLGTSGNGSNLTNTFTAAANHTTNLVSGETLATSLGKILKWFADLGAAAWLAVGTAAGTVAAGDHTHSIYAALSHAHGNITNAGAIGSTTDLPVVTGASGVLTTGVFATDAEIDAIVV